MKEITSSQFESEVLRSDMPVLVDFYTEGCGPCRQMSPILGEIEAASSRVLKVVKMDASADTQFSASFQCRPSCSSIGASNSGRSWAHGARET
jgi:thioredoxin 1